LYIVCEFCWCVELNIKFLLVFVILVLSAFMLNNVNVNASTFVVDGSTYSTVADALSAASDGDIIILGMDVYETAGLIINKNVTIDGAGYQWIFDSIIAPNENAVNVLDVPSHKTGVTLSNLTMVMSVGTADSFIYFNSSYLNLTDVGFIIDGSNDYNASIYGVYEDQNADVYLMDVWSNGSLSYSSYIGVEGASNVSIYVDGFRSFWPYQPSHGSGDFYVQVYGSSNVDFYGNDMYFDNVSNGVSLESYGTSTLDAVLLNMTVGNTDYTALYTDMNGLTGSLFVDGLDVWYTATPIELIANTYQWYNYELNNVFVNYSAHSSVVASLGSPGNSSFRLVNGTFLHSNGGRGLIINLYSGGYDEIVLDTLFIGYSFNDAILFEDGGVGNTSIILSNVVVNYSGGPAVNYLQDYNLAELSFDAYNTTIWYTDSFGFNIFTDATYDSYINIDGAFFNDTERDSVSIAATPNADLTVFLNNLSIVYTYFDGIYIYADPGGDANVNVTDVWVGYSENDAIYVYSDPGYDMTFNVTGFGVGYSGEIGIDFYHSDDVGDDVYILLRDIHINYSYWAAIYVEGGPYYDFNLTLDNVFINYSEEEGIYVDMYPYESTYVFFSDIYLVYASYDGLYIDISSDADLGFELNNVTVEHSDKSGLDIYIYGGYAETFWVDIHGVVTNYSYYQGIDFTSWSYVGYVNISDVYAGEVGASNIIGLYFAFNGGDTEYLLSDIYLNYSSGDGIWVYIQSYSSNVNLTNVVVASVGGVGIIFYGGFGEVPGPSGNVFFIEGGENTLFLENVYVLELDNPVYNPSLVISNSSWDYVGVTVYNSYFNGWILLTDLNNITLVETVFNEASAWIIDSTVRVIWTLDIQVLSQLSGLPIPGSHVVVKNNTTPMFSGYTSGGGHFTYVLDYSITPSSRTAPLLKATASSGPSTSQWVNLGGMTLPSWYTTIIINLNYTVLRISGATSAGLASLTIYGDEGVLKVFWYIDPIDPHNSRLDTYKLKIVNTYTSNNVTVFDILIRMEVGGRLVWLPGQLIIDGNTGTVLLTGPVTLFAKI